VADFDEFRIRDTRRFIENLEDALAQTPLGRTVPGLDAIEGVDASGTVYCTIRLDARGVRGRHHRRLVGRGRPARRRGRGVAGVPLRPAEGHLRPRGAAPLRSRLGAALAGLGNRLADVLSLIGEIAGEHSDNSAFPGGRWPEAVNS
jgi:hypothetical protein